MRPQDTDAQRRDAYHLAAAFYFLGVYDGSFRFDYDSEVEIAEDGSEIYEQLGRLVADEWEFPDD